MYSSGQWISPGNRAESRLVQRWEGSSPDRAKASGLGHHRDLRSGHVLEGVIRELGRTSRLLGSKGRSTGDRRKQHPGVYCSMRTPDEPNPARAGRNTKHSASTQGTGREPKANQPGRTKVVVTTLSAAGTGAARRLDQRRGEPRPKGPTIQAVRRREGEAGHDLWAREGQSRLRARYLDQRNSLGLPRGQQRVMRLGWRRPGSLASWRVLTNRMSELFTYGSVGGAGGNPGFYPGTEWRPGDAVELFGSHGGAAIGELIVRQTCARAQCYERTSVETQRGVPDYRADDRGGV